MKSGNNGGLSPRRVAVAGNPNAGKTTLFNALTGLRQKVANYPGVTVERKEGTVVFEGGGEAVLVDLPGTYSLTANSPDEQIATDVLFGLVEGLAAPELVICVVDASNLERNLYLVSQVIDSRVPVVVALNMVDVAAENGVTIDPKRLAAGLGVPVVPTIATAGTGIGELKKLMQEEIPASSKSRQWRLPVEVEEECEELRSMLEQRCRMPEPRAFHEAVTLLTSPHALKAHEDRYAPEIVEHVRKDHQRLDFLGYDCQSVFIESRYAWIKRVCDTAVVSRPRTDRSLTDRIDAVLTHKVWGLVIFLGLMAAMFQTIFAWADLPMELISGGFGWLGTLVTHLMPPGDLRDLIVHGAVAGVGAVVAFLPQILFLFLFLGLLEDTGYMARAAFMMDRLMSKVGLHGKSFIPLLSSFACAIPGIMAARTIESRKDRLVTILVAPLVGCSARLPVYTLLIASFIPARHIFGVVSLPGLTMVSMYVLGLAAALSMAWLFKKTLHRGEIPAFIMELPPYKLPSLASIFLQLRERSFLFLKRAGTFILGVSIILWFLASYPRLEGGTPSERLEYSFAGRAGHFIEPVIKPLGFNWKIGIGLIGSLLQREVFVSTMGTIEDIKDADGQGAGMALREKLRSDIDASTGKPTFTMLTAVCLMVYYVLAMQCLSTVAVVRRETNGWKWPLVQIGTMTLLAYTATWVVYNAGSFLAAG